MKVFKKIGVQLQSIKQPQKVRVLILPQNKIAFKQFYLIKNFIKLIKIDLSYNKINIFPIGFTFKQFIQLRTLFLHYNKFTTIKNLLPVTECHTIQYLTLFGNPLQQAKTRHFFINQMPNLMLMDDKIVKLQQRNPNFNLKELQVQILSFPLIVRSQQQNNKIYIEVMFEQLTKLRKLYLDANPIIKIQRWWRNLNKKKLLNIVNKRQNKQQQGKQSSFKQYRNNLDRLITQKIQVNKTSEQLIISLILQNYYFWKYFTQEIISNSNIYLSREYCLMKGIQFTEIQNRLFIRNNQSINIKYIRYSKNLIFLQKIHYYNIVVKRKRNNKNIPKQINIKMQDYYKINKNKFIQNQRKLIKKQLSYYYYVIPHLSKQQLTNIIKKQYQKAILSPSNFCTLPFFIQKLAERPIAALHIQRIWKGFKVRKRINTILKIKQKQSVIKIQRWIRRLKFIHRHKFLIEVSHYLKKQKNNQIVLQMSQIQAIQSYCTYKECSGINFIVLYQQCLFDINKNSQSVGEKIIFYSQRNPYPNYMNLTFNISSQRSNISRLKRSNILQILFKQAKDINRVIDSKGIRYVRLIYESIEQTLNRKFILALKTYRMINHQFIRNKQCPNVPNQFITNIINEINQNRLISMIYDNQNRRGQDENKFNQNKIQNNISSRSSLNIDINIIENVLCVKIKYYLAKVDLSCTFFIKQPKYGINHINSNSNIKINQYYLGKKSLSKRYGEINNGQVVSNRISRNILSFKNSQGLPSSENSTHRVNRKYSQIHGKILNTDQSHSIIDSISQDNLLNKYDNYRKMQSYDKFDRQVYPSGAQIQNHQKYEKQYNYRQLIRIKKQKIQEIKLRHKQNIEYISLQKTQNLINLRRSINKDNQQAIKKIDEARNNLQREKSKKHDLVRDHFKSASGNFQHQFLKRGIQSIQKNFRQFEKNRSYREDNHSLPINETSKPKFNVLKTQMKQFSINFSDNEGPRLSEQSIDIRNSNQPHIKELLKKRIENYDYRNQSIQSQKSQQPSEPTKGKPHIANLGHKNEEKDNQDRKKLRKKRLVHSVFPEQFYPIKQSNQIGFELPKIIKK